MGQGRTADTLLNRGGAWVLAQTGLMAAVVVAGALWPGQRQFAILNALGGMLLFGAGLCGLAGAISLRGSLSPFPKPHARTRLVQSGIYALIRHPLYTSVIAAAAGWALIRHSWPAAAATLALAVFLDQKARLEERCLRELFKEYTDYQRRTRKFIPFIH